MTAGKTVIALIAICLGAAAHAASDCGAKDKEGFSAGVSIPGHDAGREVIGSGRLPFHSAPDAVCKLPGVFILPGEKVIAYAEHKGFTSVMYINPRTKEDTMGWVETARLKRTGKGISPRQ